MRLNALLAAHDLAVIREFAAAPDVLLLGSEADELAIGPQQVTMFFQRILSEPETASWEWKQTRISAHGSIAWLFAQGDIILSTAEGSQRFPYRMTGVLECRDGDWLWRQFHGSEPARAPDLTKDRQGSGD